MTRRRRNLKRALSGAVTIAVLAVPSTAAAADVNHDGIPDRWERQNNLSLRVNQASRDQDHDGVKNLYEYRSRMKARDADSDNDGTSDYSEDADSDTLTNGQEQKTRTKPRQADSDADGTADADDNQDHDGLENEEEIDVHTNPLDADSDNDGASDDAEDCDGDGLNNEDEFGLGQDPNDGDSDDDGTPDGNENMGVVTSFDGTTLTVTQPDGTTYSAAVSPTAVIESDDVESDADEGDPAAFNLLIAGATISEIEVDAGGIITKIELAANSDYGEAEDGETEEDDS